MWCEKYNRPDKTAIFINCSVDFIGIKTDDALGDISETDSLIIPGGLYAVFSTPPASHFNFVNTIHRTWLYLWQWLYENDYRFTGGYHFETYVEESRTFSEDIYIPVGKKGEEK